ncbi:hypothetical protein HMI56_006835 [Coelomomyces lativittatus]|nr:hypothetical protein HMI56_006835 [Coelomomyces lativittatus]
MTNDLDSKPLEGGNNKTIRSVCVYCGSSFGKLPNIQQVVTALANEFVARNIRLIYGGGNLGIMGYLASAIHNCDAFITLPGGLGTLEETVETITWSQLNIHAKPIVIFNYQGFYDSLRTWIQQASLQGFVPTSAANIPVFVDSVHDIFSSLLTYSVENKPFNYQWKKTYI